MRNVRSVIFGGDESERPVASSVALREPLRLASRAGGVRREPLRLASRAGGARRPSLPAARARALAGLLGLAAIVLGGGWLALGSAADATLIDTAGAPAPNSVFGALRGLAPVSLGDTSFSVGLLAMLAGYVVLVLRADAVPRRPALAGVAALVGLLALAPPLFSSDVFGYIAYARLDVVHGINPYLHGPAAAPHDPILPLVYWQDPSSPYGPLFTLLSFGVGGSTLGVALWTMKALAALSYLATLGFLWKAAERLGRSPLRAVLVVGANPVLLLFALGGAHNDVLTMALVAGGIWLLATRRTSAAGIALVGAAAVKLSGGLLLPFALLAARPRRKFLIGSAAAGAAVAAVTFAVFGPHVLDTILGLATDPQFNAEYSGPDLLGRLLGTGAGTAVHVISLLAGAAVLICVVRALRDGMDWLTAAGWGAVAAVCLAPSFVPWYLAWPMPMAALSRSRRLRAAMLLLTCAIIATHLPLAGFASYQ